MLLVSFSKAAFGFQADGESVGAELLNVVTM